MAKSLETCVTSHGHQTTWQYYDNGELNTDRTFNVKEGCKLYQDFHSLPTTVRVKAIFECSSCELAQKKNQFNSLSREVFKKYW